MADNLSEIKKALKEEKTIIGAEKTIKNLRLGKLDTIYLALNCSESVKKEINHYSKMSDTKVVQLKLPNDELGTLCKKPFSISVLGVVKA